MIDPRAPLYVIGLLVAALGASMLVPAVLDASLGDPHAYDVLSAAIVTALAGALTAMACSNAAGPRLTIQQTFLITVGVWAMLPIFGALPFVMGATQSSFVDAYFEAMSGLTTTGSTVLTGLDDLPAGLLLWRGMLQWFGGIGIIVVAMVFLPELRVGGMQIFRTESFDTFGKILPRAGQIASRILVIYLILSGACAVAYSLAGMTPLDAFTHAMTTIATGGFANSDSSFAAYPPAAQYVACAFMLLAALPFVRYVQLLAGTARPLWRDAQVRAFFATVLVLVAGLVAWRVEDAITEEAPGLALAGTTLEETIRETLFNTVSIITGTGYASADYMGWGAFPVASIFFIGLIGGCAGSTACSVKIFRYQLLFAAIGAQVRRIHQPSGLFQPRYDGRPVGEDVLSSVMSFFVLFLAVLGAVTVGLAATGEDMLTAISGAAAALANIGPGLGEEIGPAGTFAGLTDAAKWLLSAAMLVGRLEVLAVLALFTPAFWRA